MSRGCVPTTWSVVCIPTVNLPTFITRTTAKQRRDYFAWRVPVPDSFTEMVVLRGAWSPGAVEHLLDAVETAMPALMMILELVAGGGRRQRLELQLETIENAVEMLSPTTELIGSLSACRKVMLNAILWTANIEVPKDGCPSPTPDDTQIKENLDGSK